jgi:hypothetical protein
MERDHLAWIVPQTRARVLRWRRNPGESVDDLDDAFSGALLVYAEKSSRKSHLSPRCGDNCYSIQGFLIKTTSVIRRRNASATSKSANHLKSIGSNPAYLLKEASDTYCQQHWDDFAITNPLLRDTLMRLPFRQRVVIVECCIRGRSVKDVALETGWPRQSVDRCRRVAIQKLRQWLSGVFNATDRSSR